jgi:hypothetical protein
LRSTRRRRAAHGSSSPMRGGWNISRRPKCFRHAGMR